jgi:hypothetical protein
VSGRTALAFIAKPMLVHLIQVIMVGLFSPEPIGVHRAFVSGMRGPFARGFVPRAEAFR